MNVPALLVVGRLFANLTISFPPPSCSSDGFVKTHGTYTASQGPCTLNADNYYNHYLYDAYLDGTDPSPNKTVCTEYKDIVADFAGTGPKGNLMKLTANRVGACPSLGGTCASTFYKGDDPDGWPDNETESTAHVALYNPDNSNGKLLVILPGANAANKDDKAQPKMLIQLSLRAAAAGYHVIALMHANYFAAEKCKGWAKDNGWSTVKGVHEPSEDDCMTSVIGFYAQGTELGGSYTAEFNTKWDEVSYEPVATDAVENRLGLLLYWLDKSFPSQGWDTFLPQSCFDTSLGKLCGPRNIEWSKIALAGHSMGSQIVTYLANQHEVDRLITFSGVRPRLQDVLNAGTSDVPSFLSNAGATPASRKYALMSEYDDDYQYMYLNQLYGMSLLYIGSGYEGVKWGAEDTVFADSQRILIGTEDPSPEGCGGHTWVVRECGGSSTLYRPAWDWMLTH